MISPEPIGKWGHGVVSVAGGDSANTNCGAAHTYPKQSSAPPQDSHLFQRQSLEMNTSVPVNNTVQLVVQMERRLIIETGSI